MTDTPKDCALITGGSKGIGRAIALQLSLDHGWHILINYASDTAAAEQTLADLKERGGEGELLPFDVRDKEAVGTAITHWQTKNPDKFIRVLVNNAGIKQDGLFMWMEEENWDDVLGVSLKGMYNLTRTIIRAMLRKRTGRIINIVSLSGVRGMAGQVNYSAAKAGMIGATKALAQEVAKRKITVNAVAPGFINTGMIADQDEARYLPLIPAGRVGEPEEVAHLVSFLASDKAAYINGAVIHVNGGLYT
jgi:3-oxoacyl-[acyl-carrier protein] reductase